MVTPAAASLAYSHTQPLAVRVDGSKRIGRLSAISPKAMMMELRTSAGISWVENSGSMMKAKPKRAEATPISSA